jgi:NADPH:quinone reductase-like Zn-dependent oxidoreductase
MVRAMEAHETRPVIDRMFAFEDVPEALEYLASGGHFGKVCVTIDDSHVTPRRRSAQAAQPA